MGCNHTGEGLLLPLTGSQRCQLINDLGQSARCRTEVEENLIPGHQVKLAPSHLPVRLRGAVSDEVQVVVSDVMENMTPELDGSDTPM